jgi:voltage-gated potassium channel
MLALSIGFVVVLLAPEVDPHLPGSVRSGLSVADYGMWAAFAAEYVALFVTAPRRWEFVKRHPLDLAIVVVPMLRPIRVLRALRLLRLFAAASSVSWRSKSRFLSQAAAAAGVFATVLVLIVAAGVFDVERSANGSNIHTYGDALWWAVSTVTTVGYGDRFPVTAAGKLMAVTLMVSGIVLLGVVTAAVAGWFVRIVQGDTEDQLRVLTAEVAALREEIARSRQAS